MNELGALARGLLAASNATVRTSHSVRAVREGEGGRLTLSYTGTARKGGGGGGFIFLNEAPPAH